MLLKIEDLLRGTNIKKCISSVHPDNLYSLNNMLNMGYKIKVRTKLYGGLDRYILEKTL